MKHDSRRSKEWEAITNAITYYSYLMVYSRKRITITCLNVTTHNSEVRRWIIYNYTSHGPQCGQIRPSRHLQWLLLFDLLVLLREWQTPIMKADFGSWILLSRLTFAWHNLSRTRAITTEFHGNLMLFSVTISALTGFPIFLSYNTRISLNCPASMHVFLQNNDCFIRWPVIHHK